MENEQNLINSKIQNIISNVELLPLSSKIELAILNYTLLLDEEKATILSIWYQYKHDNLYFENLSVNFGNYNPKIFLPPVNVDNRKNYGFILKGILNVKGYQGIDEVLLNNIKTTKEEFEIDRLLYIIFSVSSSFNIASNDLLMLSHKNWKKLGCIPFHYDLLLIKTRIDVLFYRKEYKFALQEATKIYKILESEKYHNKLNWFKYQFTNALLSFYEEGFNVEIYTEQELLEKRDNYEDAGDMEDMLSNF